MRKIPLMYSALIAKAIRGDPVSAADVSGIPGLKGADVFGLFEAATRVREAMRPPVVDLCSIVSAKTGACAEDCAYCSQSSVSSASVKTSGLISLEEVVRRARAARKHGARRFCIVTSGRRVSGRELEAIATMLGAVRDEGLLPCATLGMLGLDELAMLRGAGLQRYHHNLETSRGFFPNICTTHTFDDKLATIKAVSQAGLELCSGGLFGMGETWADRVSMALALRDLGADSVPINFLVPVNGTPLGKRAPLGPMEALKIISLYRLIMPGREIRVCGGRLQTLGEQNSLVIAAGADGLLTGDCLTVPGHSPADDIALVRANGLGIAGLQEAR